MSQPNNQPINLQSTKNISPTNTSLSNPLTTNASPTNLSTANTTPTNTVSNSPLTNTKSTNGTNVNTTSKNTSLNKLSTKNNSKNNSLSKQETNLLSRLNNVLKMDNNSIKANLNKNKLSGEKNNLPENNNEIIKDDNYMIILGLFIAFIIVLVMFFLSKTFNIGRTLSSMKQYDYNSKITNYKISSSKENSVKLRNVVICSSYNPCHSGNQMYSYSSEQVLQKIIKTGCRFFEFSVFSSKYGEGAKPVVNSGFRHGNWRMMLNNTDFEECMHFIKLNAFTPSTQNGGCPNPNDPIFIALDLKTGYNKYVLRQIKDILIDKFNNKLLNHKFTFGFSQDNIQNITLYELKNKVIIFASKGHEGSELEELVNSTWIDYTSIDNNPNIRLSLESFVNKKKYKKNKHKNIKNKHNKNSKSSKDSKHLNINKNSINTDNYNKDNFDETNYSNEESDYSLNSLEDAFNLDNKLANKNFDKSFSNVINEDFNEQISKDYELENDILNNFSDNNTNLENDIVSKFSDVNSNELIVGTQRLNFDSEKEYDNINNKVNEKFKDKPIKRKTEKFEDQNKSIIEKMQDNEPYKELNKEEHIKAPKIIRICSKLFTHPGFDGEKIKNHNKNGLTIVVPHLEGDYFTKNYDAQFAKDLGCQFICMNFQKIDNHMAEYMNLFSKNAIIKMK